MPYWWRTINHGDWDDPGIWEFLDTPPRPYNCPAATDVAEVRHEVFSWSSLLVDGDGQITVADGGTLNAYDRDITIAPDTAGMYVYGTVFCRSINLSSRLEIVGGYVEAPVNDYSSSGGGSGLAVKTGGVLVIPAYHGCEWESGAGHIDAGGKVIIRGSLDIYATPTPFHIAGGLDVHNYCSICATTEATARIRVLGTLDFDRVPGNPMPGRWELYGWLNMMGPTDIDSSTQVSFLRREAQITQDWGGKIDCADVQPRRQPCLM